MTAEVLAEAIWPDPDRGRSRKTSDASLRQKQRHEQKQQDPYGRQTQG
jgi:hypothetical protein